MDLDVFGALVFSFQSWAPCRLGSLPPPPPAALSATPASSTSHLLPWIPSLPLSAFFSSPSRAGWGLGEGTSSSLWPGAGQGLHT